LFWTTTHPTQDQKTHHPQLAGGSRLSSSFRKMKPGDQIWFYAAGDMVLFALAEAQRIYQRGGQWRLALRGRSSMALTKHLRNKDSPVWAFFAQRLPNTRAPMNRNGAWSPGEALVLPSSEAGYPWSTVGVAFDYRARYLLRPTPLADLVASSGARRLCRLTGHTTSLPAAWPDLEKALSEAVAAVASQEGAVAQEEDLARLCLLLARFEETFRAPLPGPDWALMRLGPKASLAQMLATADERAVADLLGLTRLFRDRRSDLPAASLVLNPTFAGSGYVGGADADLIASGCLIDLKVSKPGRPKPHELWQLAGYALLDWEDEYALHSLAIYFARHGLTVQWEVDELLSLLAGSPVSVASMRKEFRAFLTDLVGDVVEGPQGPSGCTRPTVRLSGPRSGVQTLTSRRPRA